MKILKSKSFTDLKQETKRLKFYCILISIFLCFQSTYMTTSRWKPNSGKFRRKSLSRKKRRSNRRKKRRSSRKKRRSSGKKRRKLTFGNHTDRVTYSQQYIGTPERQYKNHMTGIPKNLQPNYYRNLI